MTFSFIFSFFLRKSFKICCIWNFSERVVFFRCHILGPLSGDSIVITQPRRWNAGGGDGEEMLDVIDDLSLLGDRFLTNEF